MSTERAFEAGQVRESADGRSRALVEEDGFPLTTWHVKALRGSLLGGLFFEGEVVQRWPVVVSAERLAQEAELIEQRRKHNADPTTRHGGQPVQMPPPIHIRGSMVQGCADQATAPTTLSPHLVTCPACLIAWNARPGQTVVRAGGSPDPSEWNGTTLQGSIDILVEKLVLGDGEDIDVRARRAVIGGLFRGVLSRHERRVLALAKAQAEDVAHEVALTEIAWTDLHGVPDAAFKAAEKLPGPTSAEKREMASHRVEDDVMGEVLPVHYIAVGGNGVAPCGWKMGADGAWSHDHERAPVTCSDCREKLRNGREPATSVAREPEPAPAAPTHAGQYLPLPAADFPHVDTLADLREERDALRARAAKLAAVEAHRDELDRDLVTAADEIARLRGQRDYLQASGTALLERARAAESLPRVAVAVIVYRVDGTVLVMKRTDGNWCHPGGRVEPGETVEECASRELGEEAGIVVPPAAVQRLSFGSLERTPSVTLPISTAPWPRYTPAPSFGSWRRCSSSCLSS